MIIFYFILTKLYVNKAQPDMSSKPPIGVTGAKKETENGNTLLRARMYNEPQKRKIPKTKILKTIFTFCIPNLGINAKASKANA